MYEKGLTHKRLSYRRPFSIAAIELAAIWVVRYYSTHSDPDSMDATVNFLVAWIPFVISIALAFIPSLERNREAHMKWRVIIIGVGALTSLLMLYQQKRNAEAAARSQQSLITSANKHSDEKFGQVEKDLHDSSADLGKRIDKLPDLLNKTESNLNASIGKVGTAPVKYAQLQFSLYDGARPLPILEMEVRPDVNGIYALDFVVTNTSDIATSSGDIWVQLCDECTFAEEPAGFDRPSGTSERARHKQFQVLNPGVTLEKMTVKFKPNRPFTDVLARFSYSCGQCGKMSAPQDLKLHFVPLT